MMDWQLLPLPDPRTPILRGFSLSFLVMIDPFWRLPKDYHSVLRLATRCDDVQRFRKLAGAAREKSAAGGCADHVLAMGKRLRHFRGCFAGSFRGTAHAGG
jgi:hypothetical protein